MRLTHQGVRDSFRWANLTTHSGPGRELWPGPPAHILHTDASLHGWGGVLNGAVPARGFHVPHYRRAHINVLELVAVRPALESFWRFLTRRDTGVLLKAGPTVAVGAVNNMSSRSAPLMREVRHLHALYEAWGLSLRADLLPSAVNACVARLSRDNNVTDWSLGADAYAELEHRFGPHTLDLLASHLNT